MVEGGSPGVITEDPRSPKRGGAWSTVECGLWAGAPGSTPSFPTTSWLCDLQLPCLNFLYSQTGYNLSPSAGTLMEVSGSRDGDAVRGHGFAVMTVVTTVALTWAHLSPSGAGTHGLAEPVRLPVSPCAQVWDLLYFQCLLLCLLRR